MARIPRVACINDLSGFGRCSLTTALPVLSVMGVQACPVPTAVLSKHTGFPQFTFHDLTDALPAYLASWDDLAFDWVFSGFLGSLGQIGIVRDFFRTRKTRCPECSILLDPVMGDGGRRYSTYTPALCDAMRELVSHADVITPNITEACLLTGLAYPGETLSDEAAVALARRLMQLGCKAVVITGIVQGDTIGNLTWDGNTAHRTAVPRAKEYISGTGDLFASVLCGGLAHGMTLPDAVGTAGDFVSEVIAFTTAQQAPVADGLLFEPLLYRLRGETG